VSDNKKMPGAQMKHFVGVAVVFLFFIFGFTATYFANGFNVTFEQASKSPSRDPAAIRRVYDFSDLQGSALDSASKQRLISGALVVTDNSNIGIGLGHFVLRGQDGQKAFACQTYSKVVLTFEGDGMMVGGEKPQMEVEGACDVSADINSIAPLWIPVAKILGEAVADGEFDFREGKPVKIRFANVSDQWPTTWVLKSVRLVDPIKSASVIVEEKELRAIAPKPLMINFR
jgi:hypothetical protein